MPHKKEFADRAIGYDGDAPTAWYTLLFLTIFVISFVYTTTVEARNYVEDPMPEVESREVIEARIKEDRRQVFLGELHYCESLGDDYAVGDNGDSNGGYQVQKPTLEDWLGRTTTYDEYYSIVTDYATIHPLVYDAYFERGESWRWEICTKKLNAKGIWAS